MSSRSNAEIIEAATSLWTERGFEHATHRELARRLGMGLGALYARFPSKEDLVLQLYNDLSRQAVKAASDAPQSPERTTQMQRFMHRKLELLAPHRSVLASIFREAVDPNSAVSPLGSQSADARKTTCQHLAEILGEEPTSPIVSAAWMAHAFVILYWLHDRSDDYRDTHSVVEMLGSLLEFTPVVASVPEGQRALDLLSRVIRTQSSAATDAVSQSTAPTHEVDVVVVGAGPIGVLYASWLKLERPELTIVCLEKLDQPRHKIGESTLSGFCKACRSVGIPHEAFQKLFYLKNGLGFFHVDESTHDVTDASEYILETFDETFQVERRPLDTLLIENARRLGVQIIQGADFDVKASEFSRDGSMAVYRVANETFRAKCRLIVDASGPAGVLGNHFGLFDSPHTNFQTGAVWGYFKNVRRLKDRQWNRVAQFPRDEYTQHVCFREGWLWYIPVYSWQDAPTGNLERMVREMLPTESKARQCVTSQPFTNANRKQLAREFGCPVEEITSIGLVLREDRDREMASDPQAAFQAYRKRYPVINELLDGAELLQGHYDEPYPMTSRCNFRRCARQIAGDGWLLIGDAAFFVDPLISPGLTGGAASAYSAFRSTLAAFDQNHSGRETFVDYEQSVHQLHAALERDNQLVYMSFNHPEAMTLIQRFQEIDARQHFNDHGASTYGLDDTNVWGILNDDYQDLQRRLVSIMREEEARVGETVPVAEQSSRDYERMVKRMQAILLSRLDESEALTPYLKQNDLPSRLALGSVS